VNGDLAWTDERSLSTNESAKTVKEKYHPFPEKGANLPVRRVGQPKDLAAAYIFAMENPYLTGQVIVVDGGSSIS
jgi:NAD(P)-dependent dehydrogenase (short-subunit alcohol dehydrogenase family)